MKDKDRLNIYSKEFVVELLAEYGIVPIQILPYAKTVCFSDGIDTTKDYIFDAFQDRCLFIGSMIYQKSDTYLGTFSIAIHINGNQPASLVGKINDDIQVGITIPINENTGSLVFDLIVFDKFEIVAEAYNASDNSIFSFAGFIVRY